MNKTLITFFTVLFCLTSSVSWSTEYKDLAERDGIFYKKFSDIPFTGKISGKKTGSFKNGKKDGSWIEYHKNGQLYYKGNYKLGLAEGSIVAYHNNGKLWYKGNYKNGLLNGQWVTYFYNGKLSMKGNYKNNSREGYYIEYNLDGIKVKEESGMYKNGVKTSD